MVAIKFSPDKNYFQILYDLKSTDSPFLTELPPCNFPEYFLSASIYLENGNARLEYNPTCQTLPGKIKFHQDFKQSFDNSISLTIETQITNNENNSKQIFTYWTAASLSIFEHQSLKISLFHYSGIII